MTRKSTQEGVPFSIAEHLTPDVARDMHNIRSGLRARPNTSEKLAALFDEGEIVNRIFAQALADCPDCGSFLAELLAFLWKKRGQLEDTNVCFRSDFARYESSRPRTLKASPVRKLIYRLIRTAETEKTWFLYWNSLPVSKRRQRLPPPSNGIATQELLDLPELSPSGNAIQRWTEVLVYPYLKRNAAFLKRDPEIGNLKIALDKNGKFQVSRLKKPAREYAEIGYYLNQI